MRATTDLGVSDTFERSAAEINREMDCNESALRWDGAHGYIDHLYVTSADHASHDGVWGTYTRSCVVSRSMAASDSEAAPAAVTRDLSDIGHVGNFGWSAAPTDKAKYVQALKDSTAD